MFSDQYRQTRAQAISKRGANRPGSSCSQRLGREFAAMTGTDLRLIIIIICAACSVAVKYSAIGVRD